MDQSASDVAEKTQKPKNQENYKYGPQHKFYSGISSADYVQPRSKKIKSKIGIGIPRSQSKMYPVAPACLIVFIKCMFVLSLERFTSSQFPFGVLPWICPVSFGAGPEVPHLSLRQTLGRCRSIDRTFVSVCLSLHSNRL